MSTAFKQTTEYQFHELSDIFPMMSESEYRELKNDIQENGLIEPIWLYEDQIIDGRNRYKACRELGVNIQTRELNGDTSPLALVISLNLKRRHLNESQRAMIAARIANMRQGERTDIEPSVNLPKVSQENASVLLNVGDRSVRFAKEVITSGSPELITAVDTGEIAVSDAAKIADRPKDEQAEIIKQAKETKKTLSTTARRIDIDKQLQNKKPTNDKEIYLYHGDMFKVLPSLGEFDLVITDPPYGVTSHEWDKLETREWLETLKPHLANEYNLFWFCSPKHSADIEMIFRELELPIQSRIVWHRKNMSMGSKARSKFIDSWEMIFHAGNRELNFPLEWSEAWFDVQTFAVPQTNFTDTKYHPTQKPEALIERLLTFGSYPGDRILDPFAGSGTTGAVCPPDRECVLIERENEFVEIIEGRLGIERI